ncbi:MAG: Forkhead-associated protein [Deltaproteobacteria bacterium]|nr:Forkhead-associated protein [Deltaproteobacteria bacterium]
MKTLGVELWADQARGGKQNNPTVVRPATLAPTRGLRELFVGAYAKFVERCREVEEPGLAIIAVEERTGRAAGLVRLCARVERHVGAIIGRHDECDLYLSSNDRLALRHLAVILDPVTSWRAGDKGVRFRILDLRTTEGFTDEDGRSLRGLRCEGPAVLRCAGHALFAVPLGDPSDWPVSAEDAWACLPERVYFDEVDQFPRGSLPRMPASRAAGGGPVGTSPSIDLRRSVITRTHGPRDSGIGNLEAGDLAGTLELIGPKFRETIRIGHEALRDGVLLGRYARCDGAGGLADDATLSRVHALLIQIDDTMLVVDTASSNGTWEGGEKPRSRVFALDGNTELLLGKTTLARWRWLG